MPTPTELILRKKQIRFLLGLGFLLLGISVVKYILQPRDSEALPYEMLAPHTVLSQGKIEVNTLDADGWADLGFSYAQAISILKFKKSLGGNFESLQQLSKCYVISPDKLKELQSRLDFTPQNTHQNNAHLIEKKSSVLRISKAFNPNEYSETDWGKLGLNAGQIKGLMNYKQSLGGNFPDKNTFLKAYVLGIEDKIALEPYIQLPVSNPTTAYAHNAPKPKYAISLHPFNPNTLDRQGWQDLGFTEKQANAILNYKEKVLKGTFKNEEDVKRCYMISEEKFMQLQPYLNFPKTDLTTATHTPDIPKVTPTKSPTVFSQVDLNQITYAQLIEFGFDEDDAAKILGYRKKLGGFVTRSQITETYDIHTDLADKLAKTTTLDNSKVAQYNLSSAPEEWLKTHPYFKYYADKIIYIRRVEPKEEKIWKFIKASPEAVKKMKLYLH